MGNDRDTALRDAAFLNRLFLDPRGAGRPAAHWKGVLRSHGDFLGAVAANARLVQAGSGEPGRWLLACEDAWHFACGFFGLLQAGRTVVIPPNHLPATLERLGAGAEGVLSDLPALAGLPWREVRGEGPGLPAPGPLAGGTVEFWTSGSTGEPKCVLKPLASLDSEVEALEGTFGPRLEGGVFLGTVPHNHIYGCIFRILWPLATGRPFVAESCWEPTRLAGTLEHLDHAVLVSSPTLLARLEPFLAPDRLAPVQAVFSSGGALAREAALACRTWAPAGVHEVYGSTESGGIAWRTQEAAPASGHWTPFRDTAIGFQEDGALVVRSPRTGHADLRMEDGARPEAEGRFSLTGRLDRIVKVGEKRIALPELERALEAHPWVAQAAVVPLEGTRPMLGAVVILAPGQDGLERKALVAALRAHLARTTDPLALPRKWRFPAELPVSDGGKTTRKALAGLFTPSEA